MFQIGTLPPTLASRPARPICLLLHKRRWHQHRLYRPATHGPGGGQAVSGPVLSLSLPSLTFPQVTAGQSSSAQYITLKNVGNEVVSISSVTLNGPNFTNFQLTSGCNPALAVNQSCALSVVYSPAATGTSSACIVVTSNVPQSPQIVSLSGPATAPSSQLSINPDSVVFPSTTGGSAATPLSSRSPTPVALLFTSRTTPSVATTFPISLSRRLTAPALSTQAPVALSASLSRRSPWVCAPPHGRSPTAHSHCFFVGYSAPFPLTSAASVKAIATAAGYNNSSVASSAFNFRSPAGSYSITVSVTATPAGTAKSLPVSPIVLTLNVN